MKSKAQLQAIRNHRDGWMFTWFWIMVLSAVLGIGLAIGYSEYWQPIVIVTTIVTALSWLRYDSHRLLIKQIDENLPFAK